MTVKEAQNHIKQIEVLCKNAQDFDDQHPELLRETDFFCDMVAYLCDYRKILERSISEAELKL